MLSPGNVSPVCRLLPGFDAFFRIVQLMAHPPLTPTMSLFESLKNIDGGQEQPKWIFDNFRLFCSPLYVNSPAFAEFLDIKCT
jgi:hypothetical protein